MHSLSGRVLRRDSVDSGMACTVFGEAGQAVRFEDGKGNRREFAYDELLRPVALHESGPQQSLVCSERYTYGSAAVELAPHNLCGRLQRHDDTAGSRCIRGYALGGGISHESRRFSLRPEWPDWPLAVEEREALLEPASASSAWRYGPLGEVLVFTDAGGNQQETGLNLAGESKQIKVRLKDGAVHGLLVGARYNAFGRMEQETLGNGVCLQRRYREEDGRLQYLSARRANGEILQDLHYDYDPVGNVLSLEDLARPLLHFANQRIEARCEYTYDSLYQLIEATGWEAGAAGRGPGALPDPRALSNYRQTYDYDAGGNLLDLVHTGAQAHGRTLVAAKHANRCLPANEDFDAGFDANGNPLQLQPGQALAWNLRNELHEVRPVTRQGGPDDWERYLYDGAGQRLRKFASAQAAKRTLIREARYLPGLEQHEKTAERLQVVVVQAGTCSVRILDWQAGRPDEVPQQQIRYALADHLGSSSLELDAGAALISHEVFHPFGSTAWWAGRNEIEAGYKSVRYSGKERDATGLYYYGARYYRTDWQRWLSADPAGEADGLNLYRMVAGSPINNLDADGRQGRDVIDHAEATLEQGGHRLLANGFEHFDTGWQDKVREAVGIVQQWTSAARAGLEGGLDQSYVQEAIAATFGADVLRLPESLEKTKGELSLRLEKAQAYLQGAIAERGGQLLVAGFADQRLQALTLKSHALGARIAISSSAMQGSMLNLAATLLHEALHGSGTEAGRDWEADDVLDYWYVLPVLKDGAGVHELEEMLHRNAERAAREGPDEDRMGELGKRMYLRLSDRLATQFGRPQASSAEARRHYFKVYPRMRQAIILRNADSLTAFAMSFDRFRKH